MKKSRALQAKISSTSGPSLDCPSTESVNSATLFNHDGGNLLSSIDLSTVKSNLQEDTSSGTPLNNLKKACHLSSSISSINSYSKGDSKTFTPDSCSLVPSKVPLSNNNIFGKNFVSSFTKYSSLDNLHGSFLKDNSKNLQSESPVNFECLKCGLGFPCTVFVCRRTNLSNDTHDPKLVDDNIEIESFNDYFPSAIYAPTEKISVNKYLSEYDDIFSSCETPTDTYKIVSSHFLDEPNTHFISNKENSPLKNKMQCKNDLKELSPDCKLSRNSTNVSILGDSNMSDSQQVLKIQNNDTDSVCKGSPFKNLFSPSKIINSIEKPSTDLPIESLSQGTRNFLIELAASNATKASNESESGYALSTINSPFSRRNKKNEITLDSNESKTISEYVEVPINNDSVSILNDSNVITINDDVCLSNDASLSFQNDVDISVTTDTNVIVSDAKNVSMLNDQVVSILDGAHVEAEEKLAVSTDLNNITDTKDVVNALDYIEQSSLHDREMSSAEICNSLNQIFSESNVVFSTTADSNLEGDQTAGTGVDSETITLQTVDSNDENLETNTINLENNTINLGNSIINLENNTINLGTSTINLADLYSGENSELCQQILLVQDESGNIETVLLLPQDAQLVESISSHEVDDSEPMLLSDNISENTSKETEIEAEQCILVNNVSTDKMSDQAQNVLIMQDIVDNGNSFLTLESVSEQQHKVDLEDSIIKTKILSPQKDLVTDHDKSEIKVTEEKNILAKEFLNQFKNSVLIDKDINFDNVPPTDKSTVSIATNNDNKAKILSRSQMPGVNQNEQEFLNKCSRDLASRSVDIQPVGTTLKQGCESNTQQEFLIKFSQDLASRSVEIQPVSTTLKHGCDEISKAANDDFDDSEVCILKQTSGEADNHSKSLNEQKRKFSGIIDNDYVDTLNLNKNSDELSVNSIANISDSNLLTCVSVSSKAKKRFSINGANCLKPVQFDKHIQPSLNNMKIHDTSISTPLNGAVYLSQSASFSVQKNHQSSDLLNARRFIKSEMLKEKSVQKSKKTIVQKLNNRTAKKTVSISKENDDLAEICQLLKNSNSELLNEIFENEENFIKAKNILLKRGLNDEIIDYLLKRKTNSNCENTCNDEAIQLNGVSKAKSRTVALKTFVKPFTAAKKSVFDCKKKPNTALKTFMSRGPVKKNTALKSFPKQVQSKDNFSRSNFKNRVNSIMNQQNTYELSESCFQPQICEIKILPNEYVKRASDVLLKTNSIERPSTPEENVSEEEIKLSPACSSPMEELMLPKFPCSCVEKEIPCLCYDSSLQRICEAESTFDDKVVPCTNYVSQHYLSTPSSEIKHRAFCDMHIWRLRQHHCCPKCGIFCSQGDFLLCSFENLEKKENHLFHLSCFIIPSPGLPPSCPHCCQFSNFTTVNLQYRSASEEEQKEVPSNAQNITPEISDCDIFLRVKQDVTPDQLVDSDIYVPQKNMMELMIRSLAKENSFRLRPTAKCLYNPIKTGDIQKVMQLIANGVNPNHKFRMHGNNAPLHVAAHYGWTGILHILVQAGAYIDSVNDDLETPLIVAVEKNQLPIVRYLTLTGAQIDVKDCNGMTSFHIASKNGFKEIAQFLYNTERIDINLQDDGGWTALVWACEHKHVEFVRWLLEIGADPNVRDNEENTVLHWAAYSGKYEIAELLLEKGCTLSYVNKRGDSALHIAAREDNYECVKLFINGGAVLDQKNKENKTPLMCCQDDSLSFNYLCQSISSGALKIGKLQLEKHVVFRDISRGAEAYPIQAINEVDDEEFIMEFRYVVKQCHRSGVNIISTVDSMQFCYCKDNCVTRDCNCTMNSKCWYDANGCLTSECDLESSPVIVECNKTCHCPKTCINRVVQQGLRFPLQIFRTRYKGWGVRALQDIPKGAFVCEYVGELITGTEATQRNDDTYLFDLESQGSDYCLDGRYFGNVARFLNHSCEPNLIALKVFVEHQDMNFPRIAFFAYKEIRAFDELCFDYGLDFWIVKCQTILCVCNSQSCKYSKDTIDDTLWRFFMDTENGEQLNCES